MTTSSKNAVPAILLVLSRRQHSLDHNLSVLYLPDTKQYLMTNYRFRDDVYEMGLSIYGELVELDGGVVVFQIYGACSGNNETLPLPRLEQILLNKYVEDTYIEPVRLQYKRFYASAEQITDAHAYLYIYHGHLFHPSAKNYIEFKAPPS